MITIIVGIPGSGKTALLSYFQKMAMLAGRFDFKRAVAEIQHLKSVDFFKVELPTQKHLCYADYDFRINKKLSRYKVSGFEIATPNSHFKTIHLPVGSAIFLDEAQRYFNSRMSLFLRPEVYTFYQLHRHNDYKIFMAAQRLANIDVNIRSLAEKIIVIDNLEIKKDEYGQVLKMTWATTQFHSYEVAEKYQASKELGEVSEAGVKVEIVYVGNIFKYYDSKSNKLAFYDISQKDLEYEYFTETGYQFTKKGVIDFNNENYFIAPKGYYSKTN